MASDFQIDVGKLKKTAKSQTKETVERVDSAGEGMGFVDRTPRKKRGRPKSPRTGQVHAKVLPGVSEAISTEAKRRGVQQGVVLEEAWALYCKTHDI